jgi:hypothetical protein
MELVYTSINAEKGGVCAPSKKKKIDNGKKTHLPAALPILPLPIAPAPAPALVLVVRSLSLSLVPAPGVDAVAAGVGSALRKRVVVSTDIERRQGG